MTTLHVGDWLVNVRVDTPTALGVVESYLAAHVVGRRDGPVRYSVRVDDVRADAGRPLHQLYDGGCVALRSEDPGEVLAALADMLSDHVEHRDPLRVRAVTLLDPADRAVLLPAHLRKDVATAERQLADGGLRVVRAPFVGLDPSGAEIVVPEPAVVVDDAAASLLGGDGARRRARGSVAPGRYRLGTCILYTEGDVLVPVPAAAAVPKLIDLLDPGSTAEMATAVRTMAAVVRSTAVLGTGTGHTRRVVRAIRGRVGTVARSGA